MRVGIQYKHFGIREVVRLSSQFLVLCVPDAAKCIESSKQLDKFIVRFRADTQKSLHPPYSSSSLTELTEAGAGYISISESLAPALLKVLAVAGIEGVMYSWYQLRRFGSSSSRTYISASTSLVMIQSRMRRPLSSTNGIAPCSFVFVGSFGADFVVGEVGFRGRLEGADGGELLELEELLRGASRKCRW